MMLRSLAGSLAVLGLCAGPALSADKADAAKDALKAFNEYVGQDACYTAERVACDTREQTVRWVAAGGNQP